MANDNDHYYFGELGSLPTEPAEAPSAGSWQGTRCRVRKLFSRSGCSDRSQKGHEQPSISPQTYRDTGNDGL